MTKDLDTLRKGNAKLKELINTALEDFRVTKEATEEMPIAHLPGRLVYNRSALLDLEALVIRQKQKLPDDLKYKLSLIWKSCGRKGQEGNRGGQDASKYDPPIPSGQYAGATHRVSSDRGKQKQQHGDGRLPASVVLSPADSEEVVLSSSENAWKSSHKKLTEVDEDEKLIAEVRALLNKITPNNYEKLSSTMLTLPFAETPELLLRAVDVIFEKTLDELNYAEIDTKLCLKLIDLETTVSKANPKTVKFRTVLLQRAQEYFEKIGQKCQDDGVAEVNAMEGEEQRVKTWRHHLANMRFISELFRYEILNDRVILMCFGRLLPKKTDFSDANFDSKHIVV